jgi:hypothetical protein
MKNKFWLWLMRLAYRRIKLNQLRLPVGVPGNRDPDSPCPAYAPVKPLPFQYYRNDCQTDGHYLCKECIHRDPELSHKD